MLMRQPWRGQFKICLSPLLFWREMPLAIFHPKKPTRLSRGGRDASETTLVLTSFQFKARKVVKFQVKNTNSFLSLLVVLIRTNFEQFANILIHLWKLDQ